MIARLLHIANSRPYMRPQFYGLKKTILERRGQPDGFDVQTIDGKYCFACEGSGVYVHWSGDEDCCDRCHGSGFYKEPFAVKLNRYRLGKYKFHVPGERQFGKRRIQELLSTLVTDGRANKNITGYIEHRHYSGFKTQNACIWLFLLHGRWNWFWTAINQPTLRCKWWCHPFGWTQAFNFWRSMRRSRKRRAKQDAERKQRIESNIDVEDMPF